jgi:hypothetical protein
VSLLQGGLIKDTTYSKKTTKEIQTPQQIAEACHDFDKTQV